MNTPTKPLSTVCHSDYSQLPQVISFEARPGLIRLQLADGHAVSLPDEQDAAMLAPEYAPNMLMLRGPGPVRWPAYVVPQGLALPLMQALKLQTASGIQY